jgi:hypothetical protein
MLDRPDAAANLEQVVGRFGYETEPAVVERLAARVAALGRLEAGVASRLLRTRSADIRRLQTANLGGLDWRDFEAESARLGTDLEAHAAAQTPAAPGTEGWGFAEAFRRTAGIAARARAAFMNSNDSY